MLNNLVNFGGKIVGRGKLSILIYHQIVEKHDPIRPYEPTADMFGWQMKLLRDHLNPLSLSDALKCLDQDTLPPNAVCVTFDDGYLNNLTVATPILKNFRIPATVFVASGFSRGRNMWNDQILALFSDCERHLIHIGDRQIKLRNWPQRCALANELLEELKYLPFEERQQKVERILNQNLGVAEEPLMMNPDQLKELADLGVTVGAHTVNHPILKTLDLESQSKEIEICKSELESWIDRPVDFFAYPNGKIGKDFDENTIQLVKQAGFKAAVVTDHGTSSKTTSKFLLHRFTPWDKTPLRFHLRFLKNLADS